MGSGHGSWFIPNCVGRERSSLSCRFWLLFCSFFKKKKLALQKDTVAASSALAEGKDQRKASIWSDGTWSELREKQVYLIVKCEAWMCCNPTWPVQSSPLTFAQDTNVPPGQEYLLKAMGTLSACMCLDGACRTLPSKSKHTDWGKCNRFVWLVFTLFYFLRKSQALGQGSQLVSN